jgi:hypothetical protein
LRALVRRTLIENPVSIFRLLLRFFVMAGRSRPKDGVGSLAYVPAIHVFLA